MFESRLQNYQHFSPTSVRRQRARRAAHGSARPAGPETPAACLPQPSLRTLADRVAGRGSQQRAPHAICVSEGGFWPGRMGNRCRPGRTARPTLTQSCTHYPRQALRSLRRYPLPLRSGKEAKILQHFGDGLCRMLDQRLQQHEASGGEHWEKDSVIP